MGLNTNVCFSPYEIFSKLESKLNFKTKLKWRAVITIGFMHLFGGYWSYCYAFPAKWQTVAFALVMYCTSGAGITCGVHRLWTHKSYKATFPLRVFLMLCFSSTAQNSIYDWVRDHRIHHKFSDTEADPHNVNRGFWFSHIGWLMMKKNQLVLEKGKQIDMSDIEQDSIAMFERKYSTQLSLIFGFIIPTLVSKFAWDEEWKCAIAWQCFIRILTIFHAEMTVNSLAHIFGYKPYDNNIEPVQNAFVSTVTAGEGWHNYHHTFPYDYKAAETLDFMNWSTILIRVWAKLGLAYDLKEANPELINAVMKKRGVTFELGNK